MTSDKPRPGDGVDDGDDDNVDNNVPRPLKGASSHFKRKASRPAGKVRPKPHIRRWIVNGKADKQVSDDKARLALLFVDATPVKGAANPQKAPQKIKSHVMHNYVLKSKLNNRSPKPGLIAEDAADDSPPTLDLLPCSSWKFQQCEWHSFKPNLSLTVVA
jgi:hypothetical protein